MKGEASWRFMRRVRDKKEAGMFFFKLKGFKEGLEDVIALSSNISDVNGKTAQLVYAGYEIHDLAKYSTFEEVCFLLLFQRLPKPAELIAFMRELQANYTLPKPILKLITSFPKTADPMDVLRTTIGALASYDPDLTDMSNDANLRKTMRLIAQAPVIATTFARYADGKKPVVPKKTMTIAENFLYLLHGKPPENQKAHALDTCLILTAEHSLNASTFAARIAASTLSDLHSAICGAVGVLKGPLHGGANRQVLAMLRETPSVEEAEDYVLRKLATHEKIMGVGHRVYKTGDPRAIIASEVSRKLGEKSGDTRWYEVSKKIEETVWKKIHLKTNVDFYTASIYHYLDIDEQLFPPIFVCSRMPGWCAHVIEQFGNNRLIRPLAVYTGPKPQPYIPLEQR